MTVLFPAILIASLTLGCLANPASGADTPKSGVVSLIVENDSFYGNDEHYTNGIALTWVPTDDPAPSWFVRIARWLPWFPKNGEVHHGYVFGQNMYTPSDITVADPPPDDRPYAGWLYGTIGLAVESGRQLDQYALTLGVVGPASLAEQGQKLLHEIQGSAEPQGWDTQLDNEPGIVVTYQRSWRGLAAHRLAGLELELTPHLGGALGNVYTYVNAGMTIRLGRSLSLDYGPPRIQPSVPGLGFFVPADRFAWYLFAGFEGRAVARNIFLDGNTFQGSRSVDKEPLVGDLQGGIVLTWRGVRLAYTHVLRSPEFDGQDGSEQFGAVSLSVGF
jgi:hypothetical protein